MSTIKRSVLTKGRRTGVVVASPGQIPVDDDGLEDIEAFWNSEQQQEPSGDGKDEYEGKKKQKLTRQEIGDPKYDEHGVTTKDMSAEEKEKYYSLAEKVLVRQRKQQLRGVLSPGAQSVGTEMTEVSAVTMGNISVASPEIAGGDDVNEDSKKTGQRLSDAKSPAGSFGVGSVTSPMTPGDNSVSMSISNSFMSNKTEGKSKKLDTLLENDEDDEGKDDDLISSQKVDNTPTSSGKSINDQPDFYIDADHNNDDDNDNDFDYGADVESKQDDHFEQKSLVGENEDDSFTNKRGKRSPKDLREPTVASEDEESSYEKRKKKKQRSLTKKRKKQKGSRAGSVSFSSPMSVYLPAGPREFEDVPVSDFKRDNSSDDEEEGVRRSKRARFTPLQFWKNERVVYGPNEDPTIFGNMPIIATVQQALPTPMKRIVKAKPGKKKNISGDEVKANAAQKVIKQKKFDKRKLNKNYNYVKGEYANIWDEGSREFSNIKIVAHASGMELVELPVPKKRSSDESNIAGKAVQAFNVSQAADNIPGWISGNMILPPRGIKDAENVGICSQVFFVGDCQPGAFEVSIANPEDDEFDPVTAQRFLTSKGDFFHVPPHNIYRVENHSDTESANLFWCIIRPTS